VAIIAFRIESQLEEKLRRAAAEDNKSRTEVIREALDLYLGMRSPSGHAKAQRKRRSVREALAGDIGVWDGPADASAYTGKQLREIFGEKHRTRRV